MVPEQIASGAMSQLMNVADQYKLHKSPSRYLSISPVAGSPSGPPSVHDYEKEKEKNLKKLKPVPSWAGHFPTFSWGHAFLSLDFAENKVSHTCTCFLAFYFYAKPRKARTKLQASPAAFLMPTVRQCGVV